MVIFVSGGVNSLSDLSGGKQMEGERNAEERVRATNEQLEQTKNEQTHVLVCVTIKASCSDTHPHHDDGIQENRSGNTPP